MKKIIFLISAVFILLIAAIFVYKHFQQPDIHYHAGFIVYIDGVKQDYSDFKYMNFVPCSEHAEKKSPEEEQIEKAHLHDGVGDVVHVHRQGAVWGDLFRNIHVNVPEGSKITGFQDGQPIENVLSHPIEPDSSLIIVVGLPTGVDLNTYVTQEHIKEVESKSELCGKN